MMRILVIPLVAGALLTNCVAAFSEHRHANDAQATEKSAKKLARMAETPEQYQAVAESYQQLHDEYLEKANAEKSEWMRREQCTTGICAKYPTPADSARNLYEYYNYKASEMSDLSSKYSKMAVPALTGASK